MGRVEEAIGVYEKAIEVNPSHPNAYYNLANAYYELEKVPEARANYELALKMDENYVNALFNLGHLLVG